MPFPVSCYVEEKVSYLEASRFTDMRGSDSALTLCDGHNVLHDTNLERGSNSGCTVVGVACVCRLGQFQS